MCRAVNRSITTDEFKAPLGRVGCDTSLLLLESSLEAIKNATGGKKLDFILISDDFSAHEVNVDEHHILEAMTKTANMTHAVIANIPVFPVVGLHDYVVPFSLPNTSDWYQTILYHWEPLIICDGCEGHAHKSTTSNTLRETFLMGGYYNASIADGKMILIVLNTIYWHHRSNQDDPQVRKTALNQMTWFESQLESADGLGKKVLITSHIPPGVDVDEHEPFWLPSFTERYMDLVVGKYHKVIAGQLFGHMHKDDFRLQTQASDFDSVSNDTRKYFALIAPSLSPDYKSNPAFRVMTLDKKSMSLCDYNQYYIDLGLTKGKGVAL
ncbi:Sphingomyelinase phosphodiesterase C [Stylophora pistillata]|uniref:Sphingomyelinase phosphodiesterase C n=1 Tax=Stylophora pistillata TaxID=50429 RepID=A0A2B4RUM4_STYPI|nr:Sphingomyelinase phosphodiesterase C [Stylophora pistillata]